MTTSRVPTLSAGDLLRIRVSPVWFWEGHFSRRAINLQRLYDPEPLQVTDLDLLVFEIEATTLCAVTSVRRRGGQVGVLHGPLIG